MKTPPLAAAIVALAHTTADLNVRTTSEVGQAFRPADSASGHDPESTKIGDDYFKDDAKSVGVW